MKIGLVVYPGCMASGLFAFAELLEVSNQRSGKKHFDYQWAAVDLAPITLSLGRGAASVVLTPQVSLLDDELDAVLLPGFWSDSPANSELTIASHQVLIDALAQLNSSTIIWSYCSAVGLLAKTGKLHGHEATSTWWLAEYLQGAFHDVKWRFSKTCVFQGMNATASGVNGYLPIAQQVIRTVCGERVLRDVIKVMVIPRPETELQPFQAISVMALEDTLMRKIVLWVESAPAVELLVNGLAQSLNLTERTLARKVKARTKLSCASFMQLIKLHQASEMLIYSENPVSRISDDLGYSDDAVFRRSFKKVTSYTPSQYRQLFKR